MAVIAQADVSVLRICSGGGHLRVRVASNGRTFDRDVELDGLPTADEALDAVVTLTLFAASKLPTRAAKRALLQSGRVTVEDV